MPSGVWKAPGWPTIADYAGRGDSALRRPFLDTSELRWSEPHTGSGKRGKFSPVQSVHRVGGKVSFTTEQDLEPIAQNRQNPLWEKARYILGLNTETRQDKMELASMGSRRKEEQGSVGRICVKGLGEGWRVGQDHCPQVSNRNVLRSESAFSTSSSLRWRSTTLY